MKIETLKQLCSAKSRPEKIGLILEMLDGIPVVVNYHEGYTNIYSYLDAGADKTIALTVHHDIANPQSDNCLDNTASVYNLIELHNRLMADCEAGKLKYNILVAFVDAEEKVSCDLSGINHLVHNYHVDQLIDFELTASGDRIIMCAYGDFDFLNYPKCRTPFNNAMVAEHWRNKDPNVTCRGSACLVLVTEHDIEQIRQYGFCERWSMCHRPQDTVAKWANIEDMERLVDTIQAHFNGDAIPVQPDCEDMIFEHPMMDLNHELTTMYAGGASLDQIARAARARGIRLMIGSQFPRDM